ncbi:hypothetical protein ACHHYP_16009 [Achlya hypogyna]|uniref:Uncharacterized protein n=1 Tax=Achlya hypogyna TaxID=1202772 RepID=A0A1V9ZEW8_ACHHY|nr:hypothetical protein ACHHYP_16009 [Achlya hypogyna]
MYRVLNQIAPPSVARREANYHAFSEVVPLRLCVSNCAYSRVLVADARVFVVFGPTDAPMRGMSTGQVAFFAQDVVNASVVEFDATLFSTPDALGFVPSLLTGWTTSSCFVQAFVNSNPLDPDMMSCAGNMYSKPILLDWSVLATERTVFSLTPSRVINAFPEPPESAFLKNVTFVSPSLSAYHGRDIEMYAAVVLPPNYDKAQAYPTIYYIEGFGGTETYMQRASSFLESDAGARWKAGVCPSTPMIRIVLGSRMTYGHTSFADSATNGPWGTALVSELIPHIEETFLSNGRYLMGHSSGGWSSLWLQIQHPNIFGGTWSTSPDPVDFTSFQLADIYTTSNIYWDPFGRQYPMSRELSFLTVRFANLVERVYGRGNGGQWDAFPAIFSPRLPNGTPAPLYDKTTGIIDCSVAEHWKQYDICLLLKAQPDLLTTTLHGRETMLHHKFIGIIGKIRVFCGHEDTYYLDAACRKLQSIVHAPASAASGNYVEMIAGNHSSIKTDALYTRIMAEIMQHHSRRSTSA